MVGGRRWPPRSLAGASRRTDGDGLNFGDIIVSVMTRLMEKTVEALRSLPEEQQDAVAGFVLSEIESNRQWAATSSQYAEKLRKLADEAREDFRAGRTSELDPEKL